MPMSELARALCTADLSRIVMSAEGLPLDVGRTKRLFTPAMRRAAVARDQQCIWNGCTVSAFTLRDAPPSLVDQTPRLNFPDQQRPALRAPSPPRPPARPHHRTPRHAAGLDQATTRTRQTDRPQHARHRPQTDALHLRDPPGQPSTGPTADAPPIDGRASCWVG